MQEAQIGLETLLVIGSAVSQIVIALALCVIAVTYLARR